MDVRDATSRCSFVYKPLKVISLRWSEIAVAQILAGAQTLAPPGSGGRDRKGLQTAVATSSSKVLSGRSTKSSEELVQPNEIQ